MTNYQFNKILLEGMRSLGYEKTMSEHSEIYFIKRLENGFYISVFLYHHRFEKGAYTADFHLDYFASFGYTGLDHRLSPRIGKFLKKDERKALLNNYLECIDQENIDAWWYKSDENSVFDFVKAIEITEERYLSSYDIFNKVLENDKILFAYFNLLRTEEVILDKIEQVKQNKLKLNESLTAQPIKEKYGIDSLWYQICELEQRKKKGAKVSRSTVTLEVVSVYRNYIFEQRYGKPPFFDELLARYNKLLEDEKSK